MKFEKKNWVWLAGGVALLLTLLAVILYVTTQDTAVAGGAGAAALAAAAEATRRRNVVRAEVKAEQQRVQDSAEAIASTHSEATTAMAGEDAKVAGLDEDALKSEGERLFGGGSGS